MYCRYYHQLKDLAVLEVRAQLGDVRVIDAVMIQREQLQRRRWPIRRLRGKSLLDPYSLRRLHWACGSSIGGKRRSGDQLPCRSSASWISRGVCPCKHVILYLRRLQRAALPGRLLSDARADRSGESSRGQCRNLKRAWGPTRDTENRRSCGGFRSPCAILALSNDSRGCLAIRAAGPRCCPIGATGHPLDPLDVGIGRKV